MFGWLLGRRERFKPQARKPCIPTATMTSFPSTVYLAVSKGDFHDIVDESHHQDALARIRGGRKEAADGIDVNIVLRLEPDDPHETEAVAVVIEGEKVGNLPPEDASVMRDFLRMEGASEAHCLGEVVGGSDGESGDGAYLSVKLDMVWPPERD